MTTETQPPIDVVHLLPALDSKLMELLKSLTPEEWDQPTIAKLWTVKDVAAHLLDTNIRILSIYRDGYYGENAAIDSSAALINFLNKLNADWVQAMKRVSPQLLILLHEITGPLYCNHYKSLRPFDKSIFAVDWAGEQESKNWMHIARDYTEKWLQQQQIRNAVNKPGLMTRKFFYPFINIFMLALPHNYRNITAINGTVIKVTITTAIGGSWYLTRVADTWVLSKETIHEPSAAISIDPETSWKLFSKSLRPNDVKDTIIITGNRELAEAALHMVSVIA